MRETELWRRLEAHLGRAYARQWAEHTALPALGGRTVVEGLAAGLGAQSVWRAAWAFLDLPASER